MKAWRQVSAIHAASSRAHRHFACLNIFAVPHELSK
jgi:hypothetical protein